MSQENQDRSLAQRPNGSVLMPPSQLSVTPPGLLVPQRGYIDYNPGVFELSHPILQYEPVLFYTVLKNGRIGGGVPIPDAIGPTSVNLVTPEEDMSTRCYYPEMVIRIIIHWPGYPPYTKGINMCRLPYTQRILLREIAVAFVKMIELFRGYGLRPKPGYEDWELVNYLGLPPAMPLSRVSIVSLVHRQFANWQPILYVT